MYAFYKPVDFQNKFNTFCFYTPHSKEYSLYMFFTKINENLTCRFMESQNTINELHIRKQIYLPSLHNTLYPE